MIGNGGLSLVGKKARQKTVASQGMAPRPGAAWDIITAFPRGGTFTYKLSMKGLKELMVAGDDDAWELAQETVDPEEVQMTAFIRSKLAVPPTGKVADWLQNNEMIAGSVSRCVRMNESKLSNVTIKYLWSGGAADCVIVAVYSQKAGLASLAHATRLTAEKEGADAKSFASDARIYLSSTHFLDPAKAAQAGTVKDILRDLMKVDPSRVVAFYNTGRLALNARTGQVLAQFPTDGLPS
jgi:hypothetical protein